MVSSLQTFKEMFPWNKLWEKNSMQYMLKTIAVVGLLSVASPFGIPPVSAQVVNWKAVAIVDDPDYTKYWGSGLVYGSSEEEARSIAITQCEQASGRTCRKSRTTSVPLSWYLVVSTCEGDISSGASKFDEFAANTRAGIKLGHADGKGCQLREIYRPE